MGLGTFLYFKNLLIGVLSWYTGVAALTAGLLASISRGPWVGAIAMVLVFLLTGAHVKKNVAKFSSVVLAILIIMAVTPALNNIIDYLPFVGTVDTENVELRENLLFNAWEIILQNPILGSRNQNLEMFRNGEGIIDIVNTYLIIGLESGLIGLFLFIAIFMTICFETYQTM